MQGLGCTRSLCRCALLQVSRTINRHLLIMSSYAKATPPRPGGANAMPQQTSPSRAGSVPSNPKCTEVTNDPCMLLGSKYGPRSAHVRKRQRSRSQAESDKKRSLLHESHAETVATSSGIFTILPAEQCTPKLETSIKAAQEPVDLTGEDPAVVAVGHVLLPRQEIGDDPAVGPVSQTTRSALKSDVIEISSSTTKKDLDAAEQARQHAERQRKIAALVNRPWDYTKYGKHGMGSSLPRDSLLFTVMSYNVLAQNLLCDNLLLYSATNDEHLDWNYRSQNLLRELQTADADILCLQEVMGEHYNTFYKPELAQLGYAGTFKQRTGDKKDGCATFFKTDKFELDQAVPVEYYKPGVYCLDRDNVGLLVLLRPRGGTKKLCVANTHLLFNPRRGDVKLAQLMVLLSEIDKLAVSNSNNGSLHYHPVIFCGDLNAEPHCDLYRLIVQGSLHYDGLVTKFISGQERYGGHETYLHKELVPRSLGITDQCQYLEVLNARTRNSEKREQPRSSHPATEEQGKKQVIGFCSSENQKPSTSHLQMTTPAVPEEPSHGSPSTGAWELHPKSRTTSINEPTETVYGRVTGQLEKPTAPISRQSIWGEPNTDSAASKTVGQPAHNISSWGCSQQFPWHLIQQQIGIQLHSPSAIHVQEATHGEWTQCSGTLSHKLKLASVYSHEFQERGNGRHGPRWHKEITTHHGRANCTVDYMFYSVRKKQTYISHHRVQTQRVEEGRLRLVAKLRLPSDTKMRQVGELPNEFVSSDHVKLVAKFLLKLK